jgi:multidrug efflux pump subunit AcrB
MTGIGTISLAGVVVNNAIVLLDYVERLRNMGLSCCDALVRAGVTRLRPVLLTAVTTILGLTPMAVGVSYDFINFRWVLRSESSQWWSQMAVAVIFGLAVATLLTLVVVPVMYSVLDSFKTRIGAPWKPRTAEEE